MPVTLAACIVFSISFYLGYKGHLWPFAFCVGVSVFLSFFL